MLTFCDQWGIIANSLPALCFKSPLHTSTCALHPGWCTAPCPEHPWGGDSPLSPCACALRATWMYSLCSQPWKNPWTKEMSVSFQRLQTHSLTLECFIMPRCALTIHRGSNGQLSVCKFHFFRWNFSSWNPILSWNSFQRAFCETDAYSISSETIQHPLHDTVNLHHFPHFTMSGFKHCRNTDAYFRLEKKQDSNSLHDVLVYNMALSWVRKNSLIKERPEEENSCSS